MQPEARRRGGLGKLAGQYIAAITVIFLIYLVYSSSGNAKPSPSSSDSSPSSGTPGGDTKTHETRPPPPTSTCAPCPPAPTCPPSLPAPTIPTCPPVPAPPKASGGTCSTIGWGLRNCPQPIMNWNSGTYERAQLKQDVEIYNKFFKNKCFGTFLEMGALNGEKFSNTWFFERLLGWRGVCVEPNPVNYAELVINRPLCIDVNAAVTSTRGPLKFMQVEGYADALSGIYDAYDPKHIERIQQEVKDKGGKYSIVDIPGIPLHELLEENQIDHVDFFSLDTEGSELLILKGVDWDRVSIDVIMVENNYDTDEVKNFLAGVGYVMEVKLGPDEVFVRKDKK